MRLTQEEIELERLDFEAWATESLSFPRLDMNLDRYVDPYTHTRWQGWLARAEQAKRDNEAKEAKQC